MDRLPEPLTTFRQFVEADLRRAVRLKIKVQDEIDPQLRFATPQGDFALAVTLPPDDYERRKMFRRITTLLAWKQAPSFMLASELRQPECVYSLGVSHHEVHACLTRLLRPTPPWTDESFGPIEWMDRAQVGQEMIDILPKGAREISAKEIEMLDKWFGTNGRFPAVHIPTGAVGGL